MTDDMFDNFPLMADKIRVKSTKVLLCSEMRNGTMVVMVFCGALCPIELRELVRQVIFFESKRFHVGNGVTADFFRVHSFRTFSVTIVFSCDLDTFKVNRKHLGTFSVYVM